MARISKLRISGFRAISSEIVLEGLGSTVVLYGDNASGKSSVLGAVALLGRLLKTPVRELLGRPWPATAFLERFGLEPGVFNLNMGNRIELYARDDAGQEVSFWVLRGVDGISVELKLPSEAMALFEMWEGLGATDSASEDPRAQAVRETGLARHQLLLDQLDRAFQRLPSMALVSSPVLPVPDSLREQFFAAWSSMDLPLRRRARSAVARFGSVFPALGLGSMEPAENGPRHPRDVAWVMESASQPVELDLLGGGVQSVFATVASLALGHADVVCLEEPEAFVGERAFPGLRRGVQEALKAGSVGQVWIATHAVSLAEGSDSVFMVERVSERTTVQPATPDMLARFAPSLDAPADSLGRLGTDGSVRLPREVVDELGIAPGEFVYVVKRDQGYVLVTSDEMQRLLEGAR